MVEDKKVKLSTTHSFEFIGLNNATYGAWKKTTGTDVIIGVVDTGDDSTPFFGFKFNC